MDGHISRHAKLIKLYLEIPSKYIVKNTIKKYFKRNYDTN